MRGVKLKLLVLLLLCAMPLGGSLSLLLTGITRVPLLVYAVASVTKRWTFWPCAGRPDVATVMVAALISLHATGLD